mgnify:CR=1 FL=1
MRWVVDVDGLVGSLREVLMLFKCMAADDGGLDGGMGRFVEGDVSRATCASRDVMPREKVVLLVGIALVGPPAPTNACDDISGWSAVVYLLSVCYSCLAHFRKQNSRHLAGIL